MEPRIEGPPPDPENPYVAIDIKFINELWVPDIYVYFLKQINVLTVFTKFAGTNAFCKLLNSDMKAYIKWSLI